MTSGLTTDEIDTYHSQGYVIPEFSLSTGEIDELRSTVNNLIHNNPDTRPEQLVNAHIAKPTTEGITGAESILALTRHKGILNQVESVLGPDIILWGCQIFCKPAGDGMEVPWHQDGQYWPIRPLATCTVWLAVDDSLVSNGCLRVLPGSHTDQTLFSHHTDSRERLTLTQAIDEKHMNNYPVDDVELRAGQMSLHDVFLVHGSNQNTSTSRRAGIAIRYMPGTSIFHRDIIEPSSNSGYMIDFSQRPLWLLRGSDQTGQNDFKVGH